MDNEQDRLRPYSLIPKMSILSKQKFVLADPSTSFSYANDLNLILFSVKFDWKLIKCVCVSKIVPTVSSCTVFEI